MAERKCPFHSENPGIALQDVGALVRIGDRARFHMALEQLLAGVRFMEHDLDSARGQALAFLAMCLSAVLELGEGSQRHRFLLDASRKLDKQTSIAAIAETAEQLANELCEPFFNRRSANDDMIDRALLFIGRNFNRPLDDALIAKKLGLSTSHFRHLFRQVTGQPFLRYLVSLRLERAREMLMNGSKSVSEVALEVGFSNATTFSRAFSRRFLYAPSDLRNARPCAAVSVR